MAEVTKDTVIGDLVASHPEIAPVLARLGMGCVRCMGASTETVEGGARMNGLDVAALIRQLDQAIGSQNTEAAL